MNKLQKVTGRHFCVYCDKVNKPFLALYYSSELMYPNPSY